MKSLKRSLSLLLAGLLLTISSCGESATSVSDTNNTGNAVSDTAVETQPTEITRDNAVSSLPKLDFGETVFNILYVGEEVYRQDIYAESNGDIVDEAVYARNMKIEDTLNCKLNLIKYADSTSDTANHIGTVVLAGEDLYDICSTHQAYTCKLLSEGYFHNFADDAYIDWEKPWWNLSYMKEMGVGEDKIFFLIGDISLMCIKSLGSVYYNKDIYEQLYKDRDGLYEIVLDGKWTFDRFSEMVRDAYSDVNGNAVVDTGDRFGAFGSVYKSVEHFQYACGVTTTTRNADGIPELTLNNEKTVAFAEKFYQLYNENVGMTVNSDDKFSLTENFKNGEYLFAPLWFRHIGSLRDMTTDYGIVNFPKWSEEDDYQTLVHDGTTVFLTPITSQKTDKIGAVCELMALLNYKTVTPAYFEVALKVKYSRDESASQILDIIAGSAYTNFGYVWSSSMSNIGMLRPLAQQHTADFASWYATTVDAANAGLAKIIGLFQDS